MCIKNEKGSMAVYVSIVLLTMLLILMAIFFISNSTRKIQLISAMNVKTSYELDNARAADIYNSISVNIVNPVYIEDFDTTLSYQMNSTSYTLSNGIITLTSSSTDSKIHMNNITSFNPNKYRYIEVRYRVIQGSGFMEFFMIENPTDQTYAIKQDVIADENWHIMTIDLWSNTSVKNRNPITGWRWDWISSNNAIMEVDYIRVRE